MRNGNDIEEGQLLYGCYNAIKIRKTFNVLFMSPLSPPFNIHFYNTKTVLVF